MASRTILALLLVVCLSATLLASGGVARHGGDPTDFTVTPDNRDPNATSVEYRLSAKLVDSFDDDAPHVRPETISFRIPGATLDTCEAGTLEPENFRLNISEFTQDGYQNETLEVNGTSWNGDQVDFTIPIPDNEADQPILHENDKLELVLEDCVENPASADWYQAFVQVDGETRQGREVGFTDSSHYFGICEGCESDADAESELGRPPSATPTPTPTPTPDQSTPAPTATPTETATPGETPFPSTPTPSATATPEPTATATATPGGGNGGNGGGPTLPSVDLEGLGVSPLVIVGVVALISIGIAGLGVRKL